MSETLLFASEGSAPGDVPLSGMTLLEAYSALLKQARPVRSSLEAPTPGSAVVLDHDAGFWHLRLRNYSAEGRD